MKQLLFLALFSGSLMAMDVKITTISHDEFVQIKFRDDQKKKLQQIQIFLQHNPHGRQFSSVEEFYQWLNSNPTPRKPRKK